MKSVSYRLDDFDSKKKIIIPIGFVGENEFRQVNVDCHSVLKDHPNAVVTSVVTPPKGDPYPGTLTRAGEIVTWTISASDVVYDGYGEIQFTFTDGEKIGKTWGARTKIEASAAGNGEIPTPIQNWIDQANEKLADVEEAKNAAQAAATEIDNMTVSASGTAYGTEPTATVSEVDEHKHIAFTIPAGQPGANGQDGHTPVKGTDYWTEQDKQGIVSDVVTELIDDTTPAQGKVFSSAKVDEELTDVKSAIQGMNTATASDVGKALSPKTVTDGTVTEWQFVSGGGGSVDPQDIEDAVDAWLTENITNPDSPPLDRSLSSGSAAAPADMVGVINGELDFQSTSVDLLPTATYTDKKGLDSDGAIVTSNNYEIYEIPCDGSFTKFTATVQSNSLYNNRAIAFYNSQDAVISTLEYKTTSGASVFTDQTIPTGTAKIVLSNRKASGSVSASRSVMHSERLSDIEDDIAGNAEDIDKVGDALAYSTKNLFNEKTAVVGMINSSNGNLYPQYDEHIASDYIEVEPNTIYTISAKYKNTFLYRLEGCRYAIYTDQKVYITGADTDYGQFRTPSNAAYVRFSLKKPVIDIQFERRAFATKYIPYHAFAAVDNSDSMFLNYPRKVYAVPGLEYNWYTFNVTPEQYKGQFAWKLKKSNTKLHNYGRFIRLESNNTATSGERITVEAHSMDKDGSKVFDLVLSDPADLDNVSVLVLGDSTTANGYVVTDLHGYSGNENKITTLGTLGTAPYNHEGRSGWTLNNYFTTSANNPFYNPSTETFDAEYYFNQTGVDVPDLFIINLGINDMHYDAGSLYDAKNTADEFINKVNTVITSLRNVDANMKVAICMTIPPNVDPWGFGAAGTNIISYDDYRIANLVLCEKLIDEFDYRESEGLYLIPINASLDTQYNMPTSAQLPNSRASETLMLPDTAGNVHPNAGGYYQIADVIYAFLCATFKTT